MPDESLDRFLLGAVPSGFEGAVFDMRLCRASLRRIANPRFRPELLAPTRRSRNLRRSPRA